MFENPFWIGLYERIDGDKYEVCKITFGAEPKDYEVYDFLLKNWHKLKFSPPVKTDKVEEHKINPKRMQREINSQTVMSVKEINPKETTRASAFELWMEAPNPMVTFFKTYDVMPLIKVSKKYDMKFNMLLDFCIGKAAASVKEFYLLPVGNKLIQYDKLAVNTIVANKDGEVIAILMKTV